MRQCIVTTTINHPTEATIKFLEKTTWSDWHMVIVGDQKTPHQDYLDLEKKYTKLHYMHPDEQQRDYGALSDAIGWNKIMRRNLGYCYAYKKGSLLIASVDDDNNPYSNWDTDLVVGNTIDFDCWKSENGVFDPLSVTNASHLWHRGYPAELIPTRDQISYEGKKRRKVLIQANLWDGVPDVDSMNRIIYNNRLKLDQKHDFFGSSNIAPFNSQNIFLAREVIPYYMVIPHIGRMDDIWGAYIVQKIFPDSLVFGNATVYQERFEPHSRNIKDLKDEMLGYEFSLKFIKGEFQLPEPAAKAYEEYKKVFEKPDFSIVS